MAEKISSATKLSESIVKILKDDSADLVSSEIAIAWLDFDTACILSKTKIKIGENWQAVGSEMRQDFDNTVEGRAELEKSVQEPYLMAILSVWNSKPVSPLSEVSDEGEITNG